MAQNYCAEEGLSRIAFSARLPCISTGGSMRNLYLTAGPRNFAECLDSEGSTQNVVVGFEGIGKNFFYLSNQPYQSKGKLDIELIEVVLQGSIETGRISFTGIASYGNHFEPEQEVWKVRGWWQFGQNNLGEILLLYQCTREELGQK